MSLIYQTTQARPKARPEPRRMAKGNHGDRPRTGIRSAKVRKGTHNSVEQMINISFVGLAETL